MADTWQAASYVIASYVVMFCAVRWAIKHRPDIREENGDLVLIAMFITSPIAMPLCMAVLAVVAFLYGIARLLGLAEPNG
jgi:hypothetical protein